MATQFFRISAQAHFVFSALLLLAAATPVLADRAEAEKLVAESAAAAGKKDFAKELELSNKAVEADPTWPEGLASRGQAKRHTGDALSAIDDYNRCIELDAKRTPSDPTTVRDAKILRAIALLELDRVDEAFEDLDWALKFEPGNLMATEFLGGAYMMSGQLDRALEQYAKLNQNSWVAISSRLEVLKLEADWAGLEKACLEVKGRGFDTTADMYRTMALVGQGRAADAEILAHAAWDREPSDQSAIAVLRAMSSPLKPGEDHGQPIEWFREHVAALPPQHYYLSEEGRALVLAGRSREAIEVLSTRATFRTFDVEFWLGAAYWKEDRTAEAREAFRRARRRNDHMLANAKAVDGIEEFLKSVEDEAVAEAKAVQGKEMRVQEQSRGASAAEIEVRARKFDFEGAAADYRKLRDTVTSPMRKAEIEERMADLQGMAAALKRVVDAANAAKSPLQVSVGATAVTVVKATPSGFEFKIASGTGKHLWAALDVREFVRLATDCKLPPEELFAMGVLLWDAGAVGESWKTLDQATTSQPALRPRLNLLVARRRGIAAPAEGFVYFRGSWSTPPEKANLEKGLVRYGGEWMPAADAERMGHGERKVGSAWTSEAEASLLARGFRKEGGKWLSPKEAEELHSKWENAWTVETTHYTIKTTQSEAFARDLGVVIELAYAEYRKFWGGREPKLGKDKMVLNAYRDYEDYRRYCIDHKAEKFLNAGGFATGDSMTVAGWNKLDDLRTFLQTMVHEGAHLFYFRTCLASSPPSWLSEAMATWFEGFEWTGKEWKFTFVARDRQFFARDAIAKKIFVPFAEIAKANAADLINTDHDRAIAFYAECWSLNAFLCQTDNAAYKKAYEAYRKDAEKGNTDPVAKYFPDLKQLEADWKRFVGAK